MVYTFIRVQFYYCVVTSYDSVSTNDVKNPDHSRCGFTINELPILFLIIHNVKYEEKWGTTYNMYQATRLHTVTSAAPLIHSKCHKTKVNKMYE